MGLLQTMGGMYVAAVEQPNEQGSPAMLEASGDLTQAAQIIENAAMTLAGEVDGGRVTHLLLMSQQLERIASQLVEGDTPA
jgi:hypothetical protein